MDLVVSIIIVICIVGFLMSAFGRSRLP